MPMVCNLKKIQRVVKNKKTFSKRQLLIFARKSRPPVATSGTALKETTSCVSLQDEEIKFAL